MKVIIIAVLACLITLFGLHGENINKSKKGWIKFNLRGWITFTCAIALCILTILQVVEESASTYAKRQIANHGIKNSLIQMKNIMEWPAVVNNSTFFNTVVRLNFKVME